MQQLQLGIPNEKQKQFLLDKTKHIAFGGARGGGKSWAVRCKAVLLCLRHPGIKVMIIRKTYPELQENHILPLCELLRCQHPDPALHVAEYNDAKKHLLFPNGSRILFRYCDDDRDVQRFQGTEVDVLFIDEATQQTEDKMKKLTACVRGVNNFPKRIYYTCNPGGEGHDWVKRLFIDRRFRDWEQPGDYRFIQSLVTDNTALMEADPDYIRQLQSLPPALQDAWLHGNWNIFTGQFFEEFRPSPDPLLCREAGITVEQALQQRRFTHVIEPFDLNAGECRGWRIFRSYDFGYHKPFSLGYWAMDYDGVLYRFLELYGCTGNPDEGVRWSPDRQFEKIARLEQEHPWLRGRRIADSVADPAIWDASRGESIAETAARYGIHFSPGDNRRIPGWMQIHYRLQFDGEGYPRLYAFNTCKAFIRTMPLMLYDETDPEDLNTRLEDHCPDEVRYLCMSRPVKPILPVRERSPAQDPLDRE